MTEFGRLLRNFREQCNNPVKGGKLSQEKFGELLGDELGMKAGYSGASISYWERNEYQIHKDDRHILIALLKVLYANNGLKTLHEAEALLNAGNFRALDENEKQQIFPKDLLTLPTPSILSDMKNQGIPVEPSAGNSPRLFDFQEIIMKASDGPHPAWPRVAAAIMRKISDLVEAANPGRVLIWLPVWIFAYSLLSPSLQWPYSNHTTAKEALYLYMAATFILPLFIGLLAGTDKNLTWKSRDKASPLMIRLYTYQGAFVGFHVGYFFIFTIHLATYYLQVAPAIWVQFVLASFPVFMGAVGAYVVPDNLWRAYKRLSLSDGWIVFVFILLGPFWNWFFLEFYIFILSRTQGVLIILTALLLGVWLAARKPKSKKV